MVRCVRVPDALVLWIDADRRDGRAPRRPRRRPRARGGGRVRGRHSRPGAGLPQGRGAAPDRGARGRLLLGRAGRVSSTCAACGSVALGLRGRRQGDRGLRSGQPGRDRATRSRCEITLRPEGDLLRASSCRSSSRWRTIRPSSTARDRTSGTAVPLERSSTRATSQKRDRAGLHRAAGRRPRCSPAPIVTRVDPARRLLPGGGLPPGLPARGTRRTPTSSSTTCPRSRTSGESFPPPTGRSPSRSRAAGDSASSHRRGHAASPSGRRRWSRRARTRRCSGGAAQSPAAGWPQAPQ